MSTFVIFSSSFCNKYTVNNDFVALAAACNNGLMLA